MKTGDYHKFKTSFFALPEIKTRLLRLLSKQDYKLLTHDYEVEVPIKLLGNYLTVRDCRPHNCATDKAAFCIDLRDGSVYVMMYLDRGQGPRVRWFSSKGKYSDLPDAIRNNMCDFAAQ